MANVRATQSDRSSHSQMPSLEHAESPGPSLGPLRPLPAPRSLGPEPWATHLSIAGGVSVAKSAGHHQKQLLLLQVAQPVLIHAENLQGTQGGRQPSLPRLTPSMPSPGIQLLGPHHQLRPLVPGTEEVST